MKKILLLLLLIIPSGVWAEENSDMASDNLLNQNSQTERKYKYYKIQRNFGPYELETIENEKYPLIDYSDYIYSEYSDWTFEKLDKEYKIKTVYKYSTVSDTNNILLTDFSNNDYYVDVTSIKVLYEGQEVPYELSCTLCEKDFSNKLKEGKARVEVNGKVSLKLDKEYKTDQLNVELKFISNNDWVTWIAVNYKNDDLLNASDTKIVDNIIGEATFDIKGSSLKVKNKDKIIYKDVREDTDKDEFIEEETMFSYRDKLYQKYNEEKIYTDFLSSNPNPLIYFKDENLYKDYHIVNQTPEKQVALEDKITLEKKEEPVTSKETIIVSEPVKMESNQSLGFQNSNNKIISDKSTDNLDTSENKDYSYATLFLIIPILLFIKIILVLSKLYKEKQKSVNL